MPVFNTSCGSQGVGACAVPVQAVSRLVPFRLEAVQGFSVLLWCLTSFFDFGDKKRPPTLCAHGAGQRSDFRYEIKFYWALLLFFRIELATPSAAAKL